ncbi:hypothetical protein ACJX0J_030109, partial [Zea mays]
HVVCTSTTHTNDQYHKLLNMKINIIIVTERDDTLALLRITPGFNSFSGGGYIFKAYVYLHMQLTPLMDLLLISIQKPSLIHRSACTSGAQHGFVRSYTVYSVVYSATCTTLARTRTTTFAGQNESI